MSDTRGYLKALLRNVGLIRARVGLSEKELEDRLILGPGWIRRYETGETTPTIDMLLAMLYELNADLEELLVGLPENSEHGLERLIYAEQIDNGIDIHFRYADHNAKYRLNGGTTREFDEVVKSLRDGLSRLTDVVENQGEAIKSESVARTFLMATRLWPTANASDLWWFIIYRAYCDPYNHPARFARLDFTQSWKRTGGWALELILVMHYAPFLKRRGINIYIADGAEKRQVVDGLALTDRIEADKIDVVLTGDTAAGTRFFGVVHVKASFAERRTDDVPMSVALVRAGYTSALWTMDCKSTPGVRPVNRGELGAVQDNRSAKRKDIEDQGYFTGCFSYNQNTRPSPNSLPADRRIYICNFSNPDDEFTQFIMQRWRKFRST